MMTADWNSDGRLDAATVNWSSGDVSLLIGNGDGTFQAERRFAEGTGARSLTAADWNGDGRLDLATGNSRHEDASVLLGNGDGTFQVPQYFAAAGVSRVRTGGVAAADWDDDGRVDLATYASSAVVVLYNETRPVLCGGTQRPGDCNQDGVIDISDGVCLFGFLFLGALERLPCGDGSGGDPANRSLLDWNADARTDLSDGIALLGWLFASGPAHFLGSECQPIADCPQVCGDAG